MEKYICRYCLNFSTKEIRKNQYVSRFFDEKNKTCVCEDCVDKFHSSFVFIRHGPPVSNAELPSRFLIYGERNYHSFDIRIQWKPNVTSL